MLASPSIQKIASALAQTSTAVPPNTRTPSRILCLRLQRPSQVGASRLRQPRHIRAVAEAFLKYSPRVYFRSSLRAQSGSGEETHWIFIDIASTSHFFNSSIVSHQSSHDGAQNHEGRSLNLKQNNIQNVKQNHGEEMLMASAVSLAKDLGFGVQCAVADTPSGAQAFATSHPESYSGSATGGLLSSDFSSRVIPPGEERERLKELSLPHLLSLEGLEPWAKPSVIESMITFFMMLGFKTASDLSRFTFSSLQERWGETGALLWRRLNSQERAVISPLLPSEPLEDYVHLDFPITLTSLLLHQLQKSVDFLFSRLQGRGLFARKLILTLHCEYSKTRHKVEIEPNTPSRDNDLFLQLLENRLNQISLENPIRDFEVHIDATPEQTRQMDFFEPRNTDQNKLTMLMNLLGQASIRAGFYRIEPSITPERGWKIAQTPEESRTASDTPLNPVHFSTFDSSASKFRHNQISKNRPEAQSAIAPQPFYSASIMKAPRPTRMLQIPSSISCRNLQCMKILSVNPIERIENDWWEPSEVRRDYYFAISEKGECLWIFKNLLSNKYFLHGYFD